MIVEDESIVAMDLQYRLESLGYSVVFICDSGQMAIDKAMELSPDLILMDVVLKGKIDGIEAASIILNKKDIPIIYLTAYGDDKTIARAKLTQPYSYILKPFETRDLHTALEMALYKHQVALSLKESQEKYRLLVNNIPNAVFKGFKDGSIDFVDEKIEQLSGYKKEDFDNRSIKWIDLICDEDKEFVRDLFLKAVHGPKAYTREYRIKHKDGRFVWIQESSLIVLKNKNELDFVVGTFIDISQKKEEQEALRITNECFLSFGSRPQENIKRVVFSIGQMLKSFYAVYSKELENNIVVSEGWNLPEDFLGSNSKNGTVCFDLICKYKDAPLVIFNLDKSSYFQTDPNVKKYDLKVYVGCAVKANNKIVGSLGVVYQHPKDISDNELKIMSVLARAIGVEEERKLAQEQLIQSSRMAGIGVLSSGIAHEFNNLLAIMRTKSEMALLDKNENNCLDALNSVMHSTERAQKIVQSLLNFSKRIKSVYEEADIVFAMNETLSLVEREFQKQRITIVKNFSNVPKVYMDIGQIQQVFLNMLINVKEAVGAQGNVVIDIFSEEKSIYVKISDNGPGIHPEYINRIFEPFFTTKDSLNDGSRQGTGLGLFVSQGIIENHGGQIKVDSSPQGTCFTIILPMEK